MFIIFFVYILFLFLFFRFYVLDTSRLFPPTSVIQSGMKGSHLYQLFKPEFVKKYTTPLCSDSFGKWEIVDQEIHEYNINNATEYLFNIVIPTISSHLDIYFVSYNENVNFEIICEGDSFFPKRETKENLITNEEIEKILNTITRGGVNMRYLGLIRQRMENEIGKKIILTEIIARTAKNILRSR